MLQMPAVSGIRKSGLCLLENSEDHGSQSGIQRGPATLQLYHPQTAVTTPVQTTFQLIPSDCSRQTREHTPPHLSSQFSVHQHRRSHPHGSHKSPDMLLLLSHPWRRYLHNSSFTFSFLCSFLDTGIFHPCLCFSHYFILGHKVHDTPFPTHYFFLSIGVFLLLLLFFPFPLKFHRLGYSGERIGQFQDRTGEVLCT